MKARIKGSLSTANFLGYTDVNHNMARLEFPSGEIIIYRASELDFIPLKEKFCRIKAKAEKLIKKINIPKSFDTRLSILISIYFLTILLITIFKHM